MCDIDRLQRIKETIETLNKPYQIEILKLFIKESAIISENNNGTFINLTEVDITIINKLEEYINFVNQQQNQLTSIEHEKEIIKDEFFKLDKRNNKLKPNKEVNVVISNEN